MKNYILLSLWCIGILPATAQKIIEKHITLSSKKMIAMNFQISDSIRIITWDKSEVYVKSSINVNDNKNNDDYKMSFGEADDNVNIAGKLEMEKGTGCSGDNGCCCCCRSKISHEVYVPADADISVETINGNIIISGNLAAVRAHSISGFIDLAVSPVRKADLKLNTITGTMYSNFEFPVEEGSLRKVGGHSITTRLNGGGGKPIDLETISGNIFLRKA
jgi:DUF4097 and DUF4098 domain-containing protein YvlB